MCSLVPFRGLRRRRGPRCSTPAALEALDSRARGSRLRPARVGRVTARADLDAEVLGCRAQLVGRAARTAHGVRHGCPGMNSAFHGSVLSTELTNVIATRSPPKCDSRAGETCPPPPAVIGSNAP